MATIKSYTDLNQGKKLAKILPITSIDFAWNIFSDGSTRLLRMDDWEVSENAKLNVEIIPCWSLAALLSVLPLHLIVNNQRYAFSMIKGLDKNGETYAIKYAIFNTTFYFHLTDAYDTPVDACYEMIIKLHELNLI